MSNETKSDKKPAKSMKVDGSFAKAWKPTGEGEVLEGIFLGSQKVPGKRGDFKAHHIMTDEKVRMSVASASLDVVFAQIPRKTRVTVLFTGMMEVDNGEMRTFDVSVPDGTELIDPFDDSPESL